MCEVDMKMEKASLIAFCLMTLTLNAYGAARMETEPKANLTVTSDAFQEGQMIPSDYTCDGRNQSPLIRWTKAPAGTQSFAIIVDDPDAPGGDWVHWIVYDLPPTIDMMPRGIPAVDKLANSEKHGTNDFGKLGYGGPCPPSGVHRYVFKVYALDQMLGLEAGLKKKDLLKAMDGHILGMGKLVGTYEKKVKS
jgi:Raf kinase inhibitor-like YbhB/YbcL family protein